MSSKFRHTLVKIANNVSTMSAGGYHSLVLKNDHTLWACGDNSVGQLGDRTTTDKYTLTPMYIPW
ncbi:MAG: hypothetical protein IPK18_06925 [Sphingobacteriales bacterium]|jgi:alpha-tubulin suppressor-like RCC1 family protein|nr:MAG: hypothetical protein IPK18_06925 [Sphingobacteriales bacterium]